MPAVTQLIPSFLGGVSRQTDDKKLENQVVDIINGYPDPTDGLVKRTSMSFLYNLKKTDGTDFTGDELKDAFWFYSETKIEVTDENKDNYPDHAVGDVFNKSFMCAIHGGQVYIWDTLTGQAVEVTNEGSAYLTRPDGTFYNDGDFHSRTILDTVIITNRNKKTAMIKNTATYTPKRVGTVRLNTVLGDTEYHVFLNGTKYTYKSETSTSAEDILNGIEDAMPANVGHIRYKTSVELTFSQDTTLEVKDGRNNTLMNAYQDTVANQSLLANPSKVGRLVEVTGDAGSGEDNFYLKFTESGWQEAVNPTVDVEFDTSTMPHRLYIDDAGTWKFGPIEYTKRLIGDDDTNPVPSFIGSPINASFYYNNRLGFLSGPNVVMSQARDVYNFFAISQLTTTDADPVDVNANSTKPTELYEVVVQPQGVLLFGTRQQFWLSAPETGVLTPTRSVIQGISNYESDKNVSPLDLGTSISFVSKTPDYSKLMLMQGEGQSINPIVVEISKVVSGWLPGTITQMAVSPQNSAVLLSGRSGKDVYIYKFYNNGSEDLMQAWVRWRLPGEIQTLRIVNDLVFAVTKNGDRYTGLWGSLTTLNRSGPQFSNETFKPGGPYLDFLSKPESVVYENKETKFYTKFPLLSDKSPRVVLTLPVSDPIGSTELDYIKSLNQIPITGSDSGYWTECEQGEDATGTYFKVRGDFTGYDKGIQLGYTYDYEVTLPRFYYRLGSGESRSSDYSATLIVNRVNFAVGLTGAVTFKIKAYNSDDWVDIQPIPSADYYLADTAPLEPEQIFTVPVNQRNKYFELKVTSDFPFPTSLISMMWEGQYTPRFYQRS